LQLIVEKYAYAFAILDAKAGEVLKFLNNQTNKIEATKLDKGIIDKAIAHAKELHDDVNGGFGSAPKFPQTSILSLVLDLYLISKDKELLNIANLTLENMTKGGLYDLVDGGFCRYSTDERWLVPHFEKMLYDNALICEVLLKAYRINDNWAFREIAFKSIDFMIEKMSQNNLFYSASDADTQGEEGKYFVYSYEEVESAFEEHHIPQELMEYLSITPSGNFEGQTIIRIAKEIPKEYAMDYYRAIDVLKALRTKREYPFIDQKILVAWNAMMIKTLFKAGRIESKYQTQAKESLKALIELLMINGVLYHSSIIGHPPKIEAFLEDFAYLGEALIEGYQSTQNEIYLIEATRLLNIAIDKYYNQGKWKFSSGEFETFADIYDSSYPSSVAVMNSFILSISSLVDVVYKKFAFKSFELNSYKVMRQPLSTPKLTTTIIRYLVDDTIIKASESNIQANLQGIDKIAKPFVFSKVDSIEGFMVCSSYSCFAHKESFEELVEAMKAL
ncbi:MAG: thioredoxin domain-containing protein, partial [Campylobacterales bacterium]|nr:thioredoxin domain-containing protein [Campylobacterales bacterium]